MMEKDEMNEVTEIDVAVDFRFRASQWELDVRENPASHVITIHGDIFLIDDDGNEDLVGETLWQRFAVGEARGHCDLFDVFDAESSEAEEVYSRVLSDPKVMDDILDGHIPEVVLLCLSIRIEPKFRGRGIGLKALEIVIWQFARGGHCVVAMQPAPLQEQGSPPLDPSVRDEACQKLCAHWGRLGFQKIDETEFVALGIRNHRVQSLALDRQKYDG